MAHGGRVEFYPRSIRFTSDQVGFDAFRVVVRELPEEGEARSRQQGLPSFLLAYRPVRERGRTTVVFGEDRENEITLNRTSCLVPPGKAFRLTWSRAAAKLATFEICPRFFEDVLNRAGIPVSGFQSLPATRIMINRQVDWLSQLLIREAEHGCRSGRLYFESLATAVLVAASLHTELRLLETGNLEAQYGRIQQAIALIEANFSSKLTIDQLARAAGLSAFHFSRLFHRVSGLTPHQYLVRCRLRHVQNLLCAGAEARSIADLAAEAGFADQAHLDRHFRRAYGTSPTQFLRAQNIASANM